MTLIALFLRLFHFPPVTSRPSESLVVRLGTEARRSIRTFPVDPTTGRPGLDSEKEVLCQDLCCAGSLCSAS